MSKTRRHFHTFKRMNDDGEKFEIKALIIRPKTPKEHQTVEIWLTAAMIEKAIRLNGQADGQNCGGAVCTKEHRHVFPHSVSGIVDWWRSRVFILEEKPRKDGVHVCREYAHYDNVEELFDTEAGLRRLLKRVRKSGRIKLTLYPVVKRGFHPVTGAKFRSSTTHGTSGGHKPRLVGSELRYYNYMRDKGAPLARI